jgi:hypothetical protein
VLRRSYDRNWVKEIALLKWLKGIFTRKKQKIEVKILWNVSDSNKSNVIKEEIKTKNAELKKVDIQQPKEIKMDLNNLRNYWLIVVDTKSMSSSKQAKDDNDSSPGNELNAKALGMPLGLKTFSIVNAPDIATAKGLFWRTLTATNPGSRGLIQVIAAATRATNLTQILPILSKPGLVWNYIPGPRESLPGQQPISRDNLMARDQYGTESAVEYSHVPPTLPEDYVTKVDKKDIGPLSAADRKLLGNDQTNQNVTPEAFSQMAANPQMFMEMMAKMMATMAGNQVKPEPPKMERLGSVYELDQAELAAINQRDPSGISEEYNDEDLQKQIENFRHKDTKVDLTIQDNDISSDEISNMAKRANSLLSNTTKQ